jgi:hypothetical protein
MNSKVREIRSKIKKSLDEGGVKTLLWRALRKSYDIILRPFMPRRQGQYNGVKVKKAKVLEETLDYDEVNSPNFEEQNIVALKDYIESEDDVLILGGGWEITTVHAHNALEEGSVTVIEGGRKQKQLLEQTLSLNEVEEVETIHGIVGDPKSIYGDTGGCPTLDINDFNPDVLQMDIEGSECSVLENMEIKPRVVIVESHGHQGCSSKEVKEKLESKGYMVSDYGPERDEESFRERC